MVGNLDNLGTVKNCYAAGPTIVPSGVLGASISSGAVVGVRAGYSSVSASYWDTETTNLKNSGGSDALTYGKSNADMKKESTFSGWDFSTVWRINPLVNYGYPYFAWQTVTPETPKHIVISANRCSTYVMISDPALTYTVAGADIAGLNMCISGALSRASGTAVGRYAITQGTLTATGPFIIDSFNPDSLCILSYFSGGEGTSASPFTISNAVELGCVSRYLGAKYSDVYYKVNNDIPLAGYLSKDSAGYNSGHFWVPIGTSELSFCGQFDGGGHTVSGMKIFLPGKSNLGLFGYCRKGGTISNTNVAISDSIYGYSNIGGIAGYCDSSTIDNCTSSGLINSYSSNAGGLVGTCNAGTIRNSVAKGTVNASKASNVGGLVGICQNTTLKNCLSDVVV